MNPRQTHPHEALVIPMSVDSFPQGYPYGFPQLFPDTRGRMALSRTIGSYDPAARLSTEALSYPHRPGTYPHLRTILKRKRLP